MVKAQKQTLTPKEESAVAADVEMKEEALTEEQSKEKATNEDKANEDKANDEKAMTKRQKIS